MTENEWRFYSDEEAERKLSIDAETMNNPNIFGLFALPYLRELGRLEHFLEWTFERQNKGKVGGENQMTETQLPYLSTREFREQFIQTLLTDEALFGRYARRFMDADEPGSDLDGFLKWCWEHHEEVQG